MAKEVYDLIGIGIGPFNLGLAALMEEGAPHLKTRFLEQEPTFEWHPGMLIDQTDLQVSFLADLVTFANPKSKYTFLNYLHKHGRLLSFYFLKKFNIPRHEYSMYCQWVARSLSNCTFGYEVTNVTYDAGDAHYRIEGKNAETLYARHVTLGTGSIPMIPPPLEGKTNEDIIHSSDYLYHEQELKSANAITVVGSGQSAAEVFYDLLEEQERYNYKLTWYTRSPGFFQLEESSIGQELFSPEYVDYFYGLPYEERQNALAVLGPLRHGVQEKTLLSIYELLYHRSVERKRSPVKIQALTEVEGVSASGENYLLSCRQWQKGQTFEHPTDKVILATGYKPLVPEWIEAMRDELEWESEQEFKVTRDYRLVFKDERPNHLFALTNLEHTHGTSATNLALSVKRNQHIVNVLTGEETYPVYRDNLFQQFMEGGDGESPEW
ncbi:lysine N(6)-hydroxylase/L-ornithine N(5)-oxygenase family protein [Natribacillus halophilus]|uniref:L-lysine N6-monooxygenase MbtG n=1 Tax=Natribacillus halophilus TaxID=549003 RepID=A0A1G8QTH1_9BACI|nr:SidA/IucD/PvdA family monooxygenase [Natribacillus halophilus]SDJ08049.1 lysine N6-hydroxylase [Natribacillus halophilus]